MASKDLLRASLKKTAPKKNKKEDLLREAIGKDSNKKRVLPALITGADNYVSKLDYSKYNVNKEEEELLREKENVLMFTRNEMAKGLAVQCQIFTECQQVFSRKGGGEGTFTAWVTDLGFSRTYVYRCLNLQKLVVHFGLKQLYDASTKLIADISRVSEKVDSKNVLDIINADNPEMRLKEILKEIRNAEEIEFVNSVEYDEETYKKRAKELTKIVRSFKTSMLKNREKMKELKEEYNDIKAEYNKTKEELDNIKKVIKNAKK